MKKLLLYTVILIALLSSILVILNWHKPYFTCSAYWVTDENGYFELSNEKVVGYHCKYRKWRFAKSYTTYRCPRGANYLKDCELEPELTGASKF